MPDATISYIADLTRRARYEVTIEHNSAIELTMLVMRKCRELNGDGGMVIYVEFRDDGKTRRHYPTGRRRAGGTKK